MSASRAASILGYHCMMHSGVRGMADSYMKISVCSDAL